MKRALWFDGSVAAICIALAGLTMALNWNSPVARALLQGQRISGLLIGSDYEDNTRHSDTLMYVSYDPQSRFLDIMSIPRDTQVTIPGLPGIKRVNETFAYEFRRSGKNFNSASLVVKSVVESLLSSGSISGITIPYFFTIDYGGFRSLIDAMGGIYVKVTEPMHYDDNWGHLHIHFNPGTYLMNGHDALTYVRFRGANADQGRVLRQQLFVKEVLKRIKNPIFIWRLPEYAKVLWGGVHTNFSIWDLISMVLEGRRMKWNNLRLFSLPGTPVGQLWKMNVENTQHIVGLMQAPAPRGDQRLEQGSRQTLQSKGAITVEIWNASTHPNAAKILMQQLRDQGFDVVKFGDFATRQERTLVIDRSGHLRPAQAVAYALRAGSPDVVSRVDLSKQVDVSIILGNDYPIPSGKKRAW